MKKAICVILLVLIVGLSAYAAYYYIDKHKDTTSSETTTETEKTEYVEMQPTTYEEITKYISNTNKRMIVIGRTGCHYCELFLPILRELATSKDFEFMYIDVKKLSDDDYRSFIESDLIIPAKCSNTEEEKTLSGGFGTPLTLFLENGQTYDCIRGYKNSEITLNALKESGYIK